MTYGEDSNSEPNPTDPALTEIVSEQIESYATLMEKGETLSVNIDETAREIDSADEEYSKEVTTLVQELRETQREVTRQTKELLERTSDHLRLLRDALQNHELSLLIIGAFGVGTILLSNFVRRQYSLSIALAYLLLVGFVFVALSIKYREFDKKDDILIQSIARNLATSNVDRYPFSHGVARKSHPKKAVSVSKKLISQMLPFLHEFIPQFNKIVNGIDSIKKRQNLIKGVKFALTRYSFELTPDLDSMFDEFISIHEDDNLWLSRLLEKLSEHFAVPTEILSLIYYETMGNTGAARQEWGYIKSNTTLIDKMAKCMVKTRVIASLKVAEENVATGVLRAAITEIQDDYSIGRLEAKISGYSDSLTGTQEVLRQIAREYSLTDWKELATAKFTPTTIAGATLEYVRSAAKFNSVDLGILQLIYESSLSEERAKSAYSLYKDKNRLKELSTFLLPDRIKLRSLTESDVSRILLNHPYLKLSLLRAAVERYEDLVDFILMYDKFLNKHGVQHDPISNEELLQIVNNPLTSEIFSQFRAISNRMIAGEISISPLLHFTDEDKFKTTMTNVCLSLFFELTDRHMLKLSCQTAYLDDNSTLILFSLIIMRTDKKSDDDIAVRMACQEASGEKSSFPYYQDFRADLLKGFLPPDTKSLATFAIDAAKTELKVYTAQALNNGLNLRQMLDGLKNSIRQFLESEISITDIDDFLRNELIKAFIVTSPFGEPMIEFFNTEAFKRALNDLKREDVRFEIFEKLSVGTGRGTRVGVVPPQTSFSTFSVLFDSLVERAKAIAGANSQSIRYENMTLYMLRISPTKEMMAVLGDSPETGLNDLIKQQWVKAALINEETISDALTTMGSIGKRKISSMPLKFILESLFNREETTLTFLSRPMISDIIAKNKVLSEDRDFAIRVDQQLKKSYGTSSITELGHNIVSMIKLRGENAVRKEFANKLRYIVSRHIMKDDVLKTYSEALFST